MILVTTHESADFDSAAGVLAALKLHPGAAASFPGAKSPAVKAYLDEERGLIPEVRPRDVKLESVETLILVDTVAPERIGRFRPLLEAPGRVSVICYDHHPVSADPPGARVHRRRTGAVSTLMVALLRENGIDLTPEQATFVALGIFEDTGGFLYAGTRPEDLQATAWLLEQGADLARVGRVLARGLTPDQVELYHAMIQEARRERIRGKEVIVATVSLDRFVREASVVVQQYVQATGAERMAALIRMEDRIIAIVRSRSDDLDASRVAATLGGGGHPSASSAVLRGKTLIEARDLLMRALRDTLVPAVRAADLATPILHTAPASTSIGETVALLNRYHVNALPVVRGGTVVGQITRQVADAAIQHGMGDRTVGDVMSAEVEVVPPEADVDTLRRRLLGRNHRFLLVGDGPSRITGVITRTELLRHLYGRDEPAASAPGASVRTLADSRGDLGPMLEKRLRPSASEVLKELGVLSSKTGAAAYLVGGVVRDLLLHRENRDLDVVVEGDACGLARAAAERLGGRLRIHEAFQTAALLLDDGLRVDFATARTEHYRKPGALPEVAPGALRQDLFRRDFTINALAVDLAPSSFGRLIDPFGGRRDLQEGKIRVLHGLSFIEDPTRVFRAVRFATRLDFEIAEETERLVHVAVRERVLDRLSPLRLRREIELLLGERRAEKGVRTAAEFRLLPAIHPALRAGRRVYARLERAEEVLAWYRLLYHGTEPLAWAMILAILAEGLDEGSREQMLERLRPARAAREIVSRAPEAVRRVASRIAGRRLPAPSFVHQVCSGEPVELLLLAMVLTSRDEVRAAVSAYLSRLRGVKADIRGGDLLRAGVPQGPAVARGLDAALRAKLDGLAPGREEQLQAALAAVRGAFRGSLDTSGKVV